MADPLRKPRWGMIQIYTGDGKGKTTAALGLALRAAGAGKRVAWVAFDKGGESHYAERRILRERFPEIRFEATGLDRIDPISGEFRFGVSDSDRTEGERALEIIRGLMENGVFDLLVLDEANISARLGIVEESRLLALLGSKPAELEVVLTGREAPDSFRAIADLITEMRPLKHYYQQGIAAREGLDY